MEKIQKVNPIYFLFNIFLPVIVLVAAVALGVILPEKVGLILSILGVGFVFLWCSFLCRKLYQTQEEKQMQALQEQGFVPNHTFSADGCTLTVDLNHGKIALVFRWNPGKAYVRPANAITNLRVDDGRGGAGFLEGSSRVSFLFEIEGTKLRVNTFTSNKRWRMDSDYILTGISKADVMVEALAAAGAKRAE